MSSSDGLTISMMEIKGMAAGMLHRINILDVIIDLCSVFPSTNTMNLFKDIILY